MLDYIVMQMSKINREKGYWSRFTNKEESKGMINHRNYRAKSVNTSIIG